MLTPPTPTTITRQTAKTGKAHLHGSLAYCQQVPWVMQASVRDNILFGAALQPKRYAAVLDACALGQDIAELPSGDATELGERGINLSGANRIQLPTLACSPPPAAHMPAAAAGQPPTRPSPAAAPSARPPARPPTQAARRRASRWPAPPTPAPPSSCWTTRCQPWTPASAASCSTAASAPAA